MYYMLALGSYFKSFDGCSIVARNNTTIIDFDSYLLIFYIVLHFNDILTLYKKRSNSCHWIFLGKTKIFFISILDTPVWYVLIVCKMQKFICYFCHIVLIYIIEYFWFADHTVKLLYTSHVAIIIILI